MKKFFLLLLVSFFVWNLTNAQTFTLKSKSVGGQATMDQVANSMGCTGKNISPQLSWENPPAGTKSFAVNMYDPDAPTGSGFWHWVVFDIPAGTNELKTGAGDISKNMMPAGAIQSITDAGKPGYIGPCPPEGHGFHRYIITVYALKVNKLGLDAKASPAMVGFYMFSNTLAKASIIFYYKR